MAEPVSLQTLLTYLTLISVPVGVFYHIMTLRNTRKNQELQLETRQSQLFMQLFQYHIDKDRWKDAWTLTEMEWGDFDDFARKYDSSVNIDNFAMRYNQWYFWEGIGLLLKKGLIDREMIYYLLSSGFGVLLAWDKFGSLIKEMRDFLDQPDLLMWFEYLAHEMRKMTEEKGTPWKSAENWGRFIREET